MAEPFNLIKLLSSPFTGLYWVKSLMIGLGIFAITFTGYGLYKAYIKKPVATQTVTAQKGSVVTVIQEMQKKKSLIPFIEVGVDQQSSRDLATYIRGGIRWEF